MKAARKIYPHVTCNEDVIYTLKTKSHSPLANTMGKTNRQQTQQDETKKWADPFNQPYPTRGNHDH